MGSEPGTGPHPRAIPDGRVAATAPVAVVGSISPLGQRVLALLGADPAVGEVVALDHDPGPTGDGVRGLGISLEGAPGVDDLKAGLEGVSSVLCLLEPGERRQGRRRHRRAPLADIVRGVLDAASSAGVGHVVVLSSALAYGARPDNPVPLTEDAPLRPNRGVAAALEAAQVEAVVEEWRDAHPGATAAVLRPTVVVASGQNGLLARALRRSPSLPAGPVEPPAQFVHLDDLAAAVEVSRRAGADGPLNVAPEGWIEGETVRALAGGPRVRLPGWATTAVVRTGWRWGVGQTPPELLPYVRHPWVVASDRLRSAGWVPEHSNEEAYVLSHRAGPLATVSPQRRQELALGATAAALAGAAAGVVALLRRRRP